MRGASYQPGDWCVVVADQGVAVLGGDIPSELVARIWERLGHGTGLSPVLEAMTGAFGTSLAAIPPFAVALTEGDAVRLAVRGGISVSVAVAGASQVVTGAGVTTWSERVLAGATELSISLPGGVPSGSWLPIADGVVLAGALRVELGASVSSGEHPAAAVRPTTPVAAALVDAVPAPTAAENEVDAQPEMAPATAAPVEPEPRPEPAASADPTEPAPASDAPTPRADATAPPPSALIDSADVLAATEGETLIPVESTIGQPVGEYDHLWGATIARPLEDAAVRPAPEPEPGSEPTTAPTVQLDLPGDHDGATISVAQARALRGGTSEPLPAQPSSVAPQTGTIRLSTGQVVALDRTVVIGRRPRSTRVGGSELPHLIAVDSPQQDISRSHVEIRPEGDSVIVVDLHTTNGTTLLRGGAEPVRLHPGEQTVVVSGDVIDIGDGVTVAFEDLP